MRHVSEKSCGENKSTYVNFIIFLPRLWGNVEKYGKARQATDGSFLAG